MSNTLRHRSGIAPLQRSARTRYTRPCEHCGQPVETTPYRAKQGWDKYCDRACFSAARLAVQTHKVCTVCGLDKPAAEYDRNRQQPARLRPECRQCRNERLRQWRLRQHPDDLLNNDLLKKHGISLADFNRLLAAQGGCCAICHRVEPGSNFPRLAVDHDHTSGDVRGLFCHECNVGIGVFDDDPERLTTAIRYLSSPPAQEAGVVTRHGRPAQELPYSGVCPYCSGTFTQLRRHVGRIHKEREAL